MMSESWLLTLHGIHGVSCRVILSIAQPHTPPSHGGGGTKALTQPIGGDGGGQPGPTI